MLEDSDWQKGSNWMYLHRDQWPTTKDVKNMSVPSEELLKQAVAAHVSSAGIIPAFNIQRFVGRSYDFLVHVMARLINSLH